MEEAVVMAFKPLIQVFVVLADVGEGVLTAEGGSGAVGMETGGGGDLGEQRWLVLVARHILVLKLIGKIIQIQAYTILKMLL